MFDISAVKKSIFGNFFIYLSVIFISYKHACVFKIILLKQNRFFNNY